MKIMVFLHGTLLMHPGGIGKTREERVGQVVAGEASTRDFASYVPVGNAVEKLTGWQEQGAIIAYLSPRREPADIDLDAGILSAFGFPAGPIEHRREGETYRQVLERRRPDFLIEDDCESIGGETEMTYPGLPPELKAAIHSIVVKEFGGIDHLPDRPDDLVRL